MSSGGAGRKRAGAGTTAPLLRAWRERALLTQEGLAERTGLNVRTIRRLESEGAARSQSSTVRLLAEALGLEPDEQAALAAALHRAPPPDDPGPVPAVPRQLPAGVPVFTGRAAELAGLGAVRPAATVAISAIDGMAGIGKTALAVHAAHRLAPDHPDGQLFIDLRGHTVGRAPVEPGDALERMLRALGVPGEQIPEQPDDRAALYRSRLAGHRVLVLLDNAASEAQVAPLVPGTPGCTVLVTSRRRLAGLDRTHAVTLGVLPPADAVALFTRTTGAQRLAGEPAGALREVVELCGRLPLAIRIAAARLRSRPTWTVAHLVEQLGDRGRLTSLEAGEHSVAAALQLSYRQLRRDAQRAYRLLGLHPGGDLETGAVAALTAGLPAQAEQVIDELVAANLLVEPEPGRYRFHDLVRMHAATTAEDGTTAAARSAALTRLLDHYCAAASRAMDLAYAYARERRPRWERDVPASVPDLPDAAAATAWIDAELPNLLAAAQHAAAQGLPGHAGHLAVTLHQHLRIRGRLTDARTLHEQALGAARAGGDRTAEAALLVCLGQAFWLLGIRERAAESYRCALPVARELDRPLLEIDALIGLGYFDHQQGRYEPATALFTRARALARRHGDRNGEREALLCLGWIALALDGPACEHFTGALAIAIASGDLTSQLQALRFLGHAHRLAGRLERAADNFGRALRVARTIGARNEEIGSLIGLGWVQRLQGRHDRAADAYREASALARRIGSANWQFEATHGTGRLHLAAGRPDDALACHRAALEMVTALGHPADAARAHDGLAHAHLALGRAAHARRHWRAALDILTGLGVEITEDDEATTAAIRAHLRRLDRPG